MAKVKKSKIGKGIDSKILEEIEELIAIQNLVEEQVNGGACIITGIFTVLMAFFLGIWFNLNYVLLGFLIVFFIEFILLTRNYIKLENRRKRLIEG